jgi:hypothetical protein
MRQIDERTATLPRRIRPARVRPWPVTVLGLLLLGQAAGLLLIAIYHLVGPVVSWDVLVEAAAARSRAAVVGLMLACLACLAGLTAVGFWRMWGQAWLQAMLLQALCLLLALILYFWQKPGFVYLLMAFSIFMVLYLNYYEVRAAFGERPIEVGEAGP